VDHDPFVVGYGRSRLVSTPDGVTDFAEADLHRPEDVLAAAARTLDFSQPIALLLMGVMGHLEDGNAYPIVRHLAGALLPGSYLALYDGGTTSSSDAFTEAQEGYDDTGAIPYHLRTPEEIAAFFDRLELVEPGWSRCRAGGRPTPVLRPICRTSAAWPGSQSPRPARVRPRA
jgi:S-adenosyl methyltransferase